MPSRHPSHISELSHPSLPHSLSKGEQSCLSGEALQSHSQSLTQVNKMGATVHPSQVWLCPKFPAEHGLLYFQSENKRQSARSWIVILSKDFSASNNVEVKCIYLKLTNYLILFCPYKNIIDHKCKGDICGLFLGYRNWLHKNIWCNALISKLSKYFWCQTVLQWVKTVASKGQLARLGVTA